MTHDDFPTFFQALHDKEPFYWQSELAKVVVNGGDWPGLLDLPTGTGKTAVIDIAVFALALEAGRPRHQARRAGLRTFFVVDRRLVVDEAARRARKIANKLRRAIRNLDEPPILREVAGALARLTGLGPESDLPVDFRPLRVATLRGGMYHDDSWAHSPSQPLVAVSTVDQIGSRLLFRGYGLGRSGRVVHAGLVGADSLILLDEAHLSGPFLATLQAIESLRRPGRPAWGPKMPELPFRIVQMSATPEKKGGAFGLDATKDRANRDLNDRLSSEKWATLDEEVPTSKDDENENRRLLAERLADRAIRMSTAKITSRAGDYTPRVVGVVVNRVDTARRVLDELKVKPGDHDVILLTGRIRPIDRDRLLSKWMQRIRAGRDRGADLDKPLFVVATQTIEVGADLDFDALVTEAASLDALRQRFGRVDRLGRLGLTHSFIVARKDYLSAKDNDPVYGTAIASTWKWLLSLAGSLKKKTRIVDFGIDALTQRLPTDPAQLEALCSPRRKAPVLLPSYLDAWVQTDPLPYPDPEVSLFLHGAESSADVQIVWRSDLTPENVTQWAEIVSLLPPCGLEAMPIPIHVARRWMKQAGESDVADVEGQLVEEDRDRKQQGRPFLRWCGPNESEVLKEADQLSPGDTVVVPSTYGGSDQFGWNPFARAQDGVIQAVNDIGDFANLVARGKPALRLHPKVVADWLPTAPADAGSSVFQSIEEHIQASLSEEGREEAPGIRDILAKIISIPELSPWAIRVCQALKEDRGKRLLYPQAMGTTEGLVLRGSGRLSPEHIRSILEGELLAEVEDSEPDMDPEEPTDDDDSSFRDRRKVTLKSHCCGVSKLAASLAQAIGLPEELVADLSLAGLLHDIGKADNRFQALLLEGDEVAAALEPEPLAKSATGRLDPGAFRRALQRSRYPQGGRHEAVSVALIQRHEETLAMAINSDLLLHLVGTHHGRGRPFWPVIADPENPSVSHALNGCVLESPARHGLERLDSGWADRFWSLVRDYGPWGLAFLEALLIMADHHRSRVEQEDQA